MNVFEWIKRIVRPCRPCRVTTYPVPPKPKMSVTEKIRRMRELHDKCDIVGHELGRIGDRWVAIRDIHDEVWVNWWKDGAEFEWDDTEEYWFTTDINKAMRVALIEDWNAGLFPER